jgi:protein CpxP
MSAFSLPISMSAGLTRSVAIAALMGATMLASPMTAARADGVASAPMQLAQATAPKVPAVVGATEAKPETVEQRITSLHSALDITATQESDWNGVAQAMRDNAAAMQKLVAAKMAADPKGMTAVADLQNYQQFAEAHVAGLKNLTSSFETLYKSMPDSQKKIADRVFQTFGRPKTPSHS